VTPPVLRTRVTPDVGHINIKGKVLLDVEVSSEGVVTNVTLKQGLSPRVDRATIKAVQQWRYTPAHRGDMNVPYTLPITVEYGLD